jgi:hypothetical protein
MGISMVPLTLGVFLVGMLLGWSSGVLGWAICGAGIVGAVIGFFLMERDLTERGFERNPPHLRRPRP